MQAPSVQQLEAALEQAALLVGGVDVDQWGAATPCADWDVRALVSHLISGNRLFAAALRGDESGRVTADDDSVGAFAGSGRELISAFAQPDALRRMVEVPFGRVPGEVALHLRITETLVHGWDLASATHQRPTFDDSVAEQELEFSRLALGAIPAERRPFGPPQQAPDGACALDQLAALLGRTVMDGG